jgi:hypothetical protein
MKDDWRIKDFKNWRIKMEYQLDDAAYLYCEINPAVDKMKDPPYSSRGYLSAIVTRELSIAYFPKDHLPPYKYHGPLPEEVWLKVKDAYRLLLKAAKEGSLPTTKYGAASRADLKSLYAERLEKKPKFLFLEEREEPHGQEITAAQDESTFTHSEDYRRVVIRSQKFDLTTQQAYLIEILHENPGIGIERIYDKIGEKQERSLKKAVFSKNKAAYDALIEQTTKGAYRLRT